MIIGLLAALIAAAWVYTDARTLAERGIRVGGTSWKPGGWAAATFLVLILFLPMYLYQRSRALRTAPPPAAPHPFCPQCSAAVPPDAAFCPQCGSRLWTAPADRRPS